MSVLFRFFFYRSNEVRSLIHFVGNFFFRANERYSYNTKFYVIDKWACLLCLMFGYIYIFFFSFSCFTFVIYRFPHQYHYCNGMILFGYFLLNKGQTKSFFCFDWLNHFLPYFVVRCDEVVRIFWLYKLKSIFFLFDITIFPIYLFFPLYIEKRFQFSKLKTLITRVDNK